MESSHHGADVVPELEAARLYDHLSDDRVQCHLCAHYCVISPGERGVCRVRINQGGKLYTQAYGWLIARHVDPVEKKPLFHFYPGSRAYSVATRGCNFRCRWCQNWEIVQMSQEQFQFLGEEASPEEIVTAAQQQECRSIAYTYTEPTIFFEYSYDTSCLARKQGLANIYVTNGYMTQSMLDLYYPYLDAANVDLKSFQDAVYRRYTGARLQPVLDSLLLMKKLDIWVEVTTLVIPGVNDEPSELRDIAGFIADELGPETPWHVTRFAPAHQMLDVPPTPPETLMQARQIGQAAGLRYVYVGNLMHEATDTVCHECGEVLIRRRGFLVVDHHIAPEGVCPACDTPVAGVGMASVTG
jgi:pyruvate formate lyase activating enzyme